jgi:hypothetical protein
MEAITRSRRVSSFCRLPLGRGALAWAISIAMGACARAVSEVPGI